MTRGLDVRPVAGRADLDRFLRLPWRIYERDPNWVPPLLSDVRRALDSRRHPFHQHAEVATFLAARDGSVIGRIAAIANRAHNEFHDDRTGFFGLFECVDEQPVADALLHAAEVWLRERGMDRVQGPMNLSTNEEICSPGVLVEGFHRPPVIQMAHTPVYYAGLLEGAGYAKDKDLIAYWLEGWEAPPRIKRAYDRLLRDGRIRLRSLDLKHLPAEIEYMAKQLKPVVNPRLCPLAEVDGEVIGFALGLPDYNMALRHVNGRLLPFGIFKLLWHRRKIDAARTITLGLKPGFRKLGLDAAMITHIYIEGNSLGIWRSECSWILEDNWDMRRGLERIGAVADKTYRLYGKTLPA